MSDFSIPPTSLQRLRTAYEQYTNLAQVVAEAMGIDRDIDCQLDLQRGVFRVVEHSASPQNGSHVAAYATNAEAFEALRQERP